MLVVSLSFSFSFFLSFFLSPCLFPDSPRPRPSVSDSSPLPFPPFFGTWHMQTCRALDSGRGNRKGRGEEGERMEDRKRTKTKHSTKNIQDSTPPSATAMLVSTSEPRCCPSFERLYGLLILGVGLLLWIPVVLVLPLLWSGSKLPVELVACLALPASYCTFAGLWKLYYT